MIECFQSLLDLISSFLIGIGLPTSNVTKITGLFAFVFLLIIIITQLNSLFKYVIIKIKSRSTVKDLHPFYSKVDIENATKYYIKTKFQNVSPSEDEEPGRNYISAAREPLIPLFVNKVFKNKSDNNKYYLVLADSGMGKTTFMINLYLTYKFKAQSFFSNYKYDIKLFPLGHPNTFNKIKEMSPEKKSNTILLLDAFDEDNYAALDYKKRLNEILDMVWEFRVVIITCRTHFFPSSKNEPKETGRFKFGPDGGQYSFQKIYISVFSEIDIKKYLTTKYSSILFIKSSKYLKALSIVLKSPNLMMRPMLLSRIEDLLTSDTAIQYDFQIYKVLIDNWIKRESNKPYIIAKYDSKYASMLYLFSRSLARHLYENRKMDEQYLSLSVNDIIDNPNGLQMIDIDAITIKYDSHDQKCNSLLNRNAIGEYKFSHKSFYE